MALSEKYRSVTNAMLAGCLFMFACSDSSVPVDPKTEAIMYIIQDELKENARLLFLLENQREFFDRVNWRGRIIEVPSRQLTRMNELALGQVDTLLLNAQHRRRRIPMPVTEFQQLYHLMLDSVSNSSSTIRAYLSEYVNGPRINYPAKGPGLENAFIYSMLLLKTQNNILLNVLNSVNHGMRHNEIPKYSVVIKQDRGLQIISIKVTGDGKWFPVRVLKLRSEEGENVEIKHSEIRNDYLTITTNELKKGEYTIEVDYSMIERQGDKYYVPVSFPFSY